MKPGPRPATDAALTQRRGPVGDQDWAAAVVLDAGRSGLCGLRAEVALDQVERQAHELERRSGIDRRDSRVLVPELPPMRGPAGS